MEKRGLKRTVTFLEFLKNYKKNQMLYQPVCFKRIFRSLLHLIVQSPVTFLGIRHKLCISLLYTSTSKFIISLNAINSLVAIFHCSYTVLYEIIRVVGKMWRYLCVLLYLDGAFASYSPSYFCADMNPQPTVIIPQLMGMWYGVEKIDHQDERHYSRSAPSCPIIHLSEDHPATTTNPLYRNRQYYGYGDQNYATGTGTPPYGGKTQEQINREMRERMEYDRRTTYRDHPARKIYNQDYINNYNNNNYYNQIGLAEEHYLRMYWDENGENTEFHLRYNVTRKGFWISSGPENGAPLKSQFGHFAGTVQVLKAVGNHMVLTICHQVPTRQLYSIILSREPKLGPVEIHSIHRMLNRKGVNTNAVMKLCNNDGTRMAGISLSVLLLIQLFVYGILNK